eukprot:763600-Hanusia_phi.AAC.3
MAYMRPPDPPQPSSSTAILFHSHPLPQPSSSIRFFKVFALLLLLPLYFPAGDGSHTSPSPFLVSSARSASRIESLLCPQSQLACWWATTS